MWQGAREKSGGEKLRALFYAVRFSTQLEVKQTLLFLIKCQQILNSTCSLGSFTHMKTIGLFQG